MRLMKRIHPTRLIVTAAAALSVITIMLATSGTASAAPDPALRQRPITVAVALGALTTPSGGHTWLSFQSRASVDATHGGFRYYCPEAGYYNGAVQSLTVIDGAIHATGAGGLVRPDGTRMRVQFTFDAAADGSAVTVSITGDEYQYDMSGSLEGFIFAGAPGDWSLR